MSARSGAERPTIVVVGGFLGSGKTSLIFAAARVLQERGMRCAVILNDQGEQLVDTRLAGRHGLHAGEVTGGCFCCRFSDLMTVIDAMRTWSPEVIFAEPVGSCTDISATVLNPLREEFARYRVAPFTVLVDPARAAALLPNDPDSDLAFLFRKQLEEADVVCLSKADLQGEFRGVPGIPARRISAMSGEGVEEWLDEILFGCLEAGGKFLEIDYGRYAEAEAALAWLNLKFTVETATPISPASMIGPFLDALDHALSAAGAEIVHLKVFDTSESGWLRAALCANGADPNIEGRLDASPANRHEVLVNLRARCSPETAREIVEGQLKQLEGRLSELRLDCFSPAPPKPERRMTNPRASTA